MKSIRNFTGTLVESNLVGELIARILGYADGRCLWTVEKLKKPGYLKLVFSTKTRLNFSKTISSDDLKFKIKQYFDSLIDYDYSEISTNNIKSEPLKGELNKMLEHDELPF